MGALLRRAICDRLTADETVLAPIIAGRAYPYDIRPAGRQGTPEAFDADGIILASFAVTDGATVRSPFAGPGTVRPAVYVWAVAARGEEGREQVGTLIRRAVQLLVHWHDPLTGAQAFYGGETGELDDGSIVQNRLTLSFAGRLPID